jgi:hypothetical protein
MGNGKKVLVLCMFGSVSLYSIDRVVAYVLHVLHACNLLLKQGIC